MSAIQTPAEARFATTQPLSLPPAIRVGMELERRGSQVPGHIGALLGEYRRRGIIGTGEVESGTALNLAARRLDSIQNRNEHVGSVEGRQKYIDERTDAWLRRQESNFAQSQQFNNEFNSRGLIERGLAATGMLPKAVSQDQSNRLFESLKPVLSQRQAEFGKEYDSMHTPGAELMRQRDTAAAYLTQNYRQLNPEAQDHEVYDYVHDELARQGYQAPGVEQVYADRGEPVSAQILEEKLKAMELGRYEANQTVVGESIQGLSNSVPYVGDLIRGVAGAPVKGLAGVFQFGASMTEAILGMHAGDGSASQRISDGTDGLLVALGLDRGVEGQPEQLSKARGFAYDLGGAIGDIGILIATRDPKAASRMAQVLPGTLYFGGREAAGMQRQAYESYVQQGMDPRDAQLLSTGVGLSAGAVTSILERVPLNEYFNPAKRTLLNRAIRGAIAEGTTEAAQELANAVIAVSANVEDVTLQELLGRVVYAGAIGAVAGGASNTLIEGAQRQGILERAERGDKQAKLMLGIDSTFRGLAQRFKGLASRGRDLITRRSGSESSTEPAPGPDGTVSGRSDPRVLATARHAGSWFSKTYNDPEQAQAVAEQVQQVGERLVLTDIPLDYLSPNMDGINTVNAGQISELDQQSREDMPPVIAGAGTDQFGRLQLIDGNTRVAGLQSGQQTQTIKAYVPESIVEAISEGRFDPTKPDSGLTGVEVIEGSEGEAVPEGDRRPGQDEGPRGREGEGEAQGSGQGAATDGELNDKRAQVDMLRRQLEEKPDDFTPNARRLIEERIAELEREIAAEDAEKAKKVKPKKKGKRSEKERADKAFEDSDRRIKDAVERNDGKAMAREAWRLKQRAEKYGRDDKADQIAALEEEAAKLGFRAESPQGKFVDGRLDVEVVAWEPNDDDARSNEMRIIEPALYDADGKLVKAAEVTVYMATEAYEAAEDAKYEADRKAAEERLGVKAKPTGKELIEQAESKLTGLKGKATATAIEDARARGRVPRSGKALGTGRHTVSIDELTPSSALDGVKIGEERVEYWRKAPHRKLTPLQVTEEADGTLIVRDGNHRLLASAIEGDTEVPIVVQRSDKAPAGEQGQDRPATEGTQTGRGSESNRAEEGQRLIEGAEQTLEELKTAIDQLSREARTNPLTGGLNRREYDRLVEAAAREADEGDTTFAIIALDAMNLKSVNDVEGDAAGDAYLKAVYEAIEGATRSGEAQGDQEARRPDAFHYGGDEFAVLVTGLDPQKAGDAARKLRDRIEAAVEAREVVKGVSTGLAGDVAIYEQGSGDTAGILDSATNAMKARKKRIKAKKGEATTREEAKKAQRGEQDDGRTARDKERAKRVRAMERFRQYAQEINPGVIQMFRDGDFYTFVGQDAIDAKKILGITQTTDRGSGIEVAGVPYVSVEGYIRKLINAERRVALVEEVQRQGQDDDAAQGSETAVDGPDGSESTAPDESNRPGDTKQALRVTDDVDLVEEVGEYVNKGLKAKLRTIQKRVGGREDAALYAGDPPADADPVNSFTNGPTAKLLTDTMVNSPGTAYDVYIFPITDGPAPTYGASIITQQEPTRAEPDENVPEAEEEPTTTREADEQAPAEESDPDTATEEDAGRAGDEAGDDQEARAAFDFIPGLDTLADEPAFELNEEVAGVTLEDAANGLMRDVNVSEPTRNRIKKALGNWRTADGDRAKEASESFLRTTVDSGIRERYNVWELQQLALQGNEPDLEAEDGRVFFVKDRKFDTPSNRKARAAFREDVTKRWEANLPGEKGLKLPGEGAAPPKLKRGPRATTRRAPKAQASLKAAITRINKHKASFINGLSEQSAGMTGAINIEGRGYLLTPYKIITLRGEDVPDKLPGRQIDLTTIHKDRVNDRIAGVKSIGRDVEQAKKQTEDVELDELWLRLNKAEAAIKGAESTGGAIVLNTDGSVGIVAVGDGVLAEINVREGYSDLGFVNLGIMKQAIDDLLSLGVERAGLGATKSMMTMEGYRGGDRVHAGFMQMLNQGVAPTSGQQAEQFNQQAAERRPATPESDTAPEVGSPLPPPTAGGITFASMPENDVNNDGQVEPGDNDKAPEVPLPAAWNARDTDPATAKENQFRRRGKDKKKAVRKSIREARARSKRDGAAVDAADNVYTILSDLSRRLGSAAPGVGRNRKLGKSAAGFIRGWTEDIRLNKGSYVATQAHELGHLLHKQLFAPKGAKQSMEEGQLNHLPKEIGAELHAMGKELYGDKKSPAGYKGEGWAEMMRMLVTEPQTLKEVAPKTYQLVTMKLKTEHPETWAAILDARIRLRNAIRFAEVDPVDQYIAYEDTGLRRPNLTALWDDVRIRMFDRFQRLQTMKRDLDLENLPANIDPHTLALRANGHISGDTKLAIEHGQFNPADATRTKIGPSLNEILEPARHNLRLLQNYMVARRTLEKRSQGYDVFPQDPRLPDMSSNAKIVQYIKRVEQEYPELGDFFKQRGPKVPMQQENGDVVYEGTEDPDTVAAQFQAFNEWLIGRYAVHYGLVSKDSADAIIAANAHYVTFRHKKTEDATLKAYNLKSSSGGFVNTGSGVRRFRQGHGEQIHPPIESFMSSMQGIMSRARLNEVGKSITAVYEQGAGGAGRWLSKIDRPMDASKITGERLSEEIMKQLGIVEINMGGATLQALPPWLEAMEEAQQQELLEALRGLQAATFWSPGNRTDRENMEVSVLVDGKPQFYEVKDARLFEMLEGLGSPAAAHAFLHAMGVPSRVLRAGATQLNISFAAVNLLRDINQALTMTDTNLKNLSKQRRARLEGIRAAFLGGKLEQLFLAGGADMSGIFGEYYDPRKKRLDFEGMFEKNRYGLIKGDTAKRIAKDLAKLGPISRVNGAMEKAVRMGEFAVVYEEQIEAGKSQAEAVATAGQAGADVTLDFQRGGTWSKQINEIVVFFNAAMLGADKLGRFIKKNPVKAAGRIFALTIMPSILSMIMNYDNEDYWAKPLGMRDRYWYFPTGRTDAGTMTYLRLPKPYGLGAFSVFFERNFARMFGMDPETGERGDDRAYRGMFMAMLNEFRPAINFAGLLPIYEVNAGEQGYSFYRDNEIVSDADKDLPLHMQGAARSSTTARFLGDMLNYPPAKIDYLVSGITGGLGRDIVGTMADPVIAHTMPEYAREGEPLEWSDYLVVRRFIAGETTSGHEAVTRFYDDHDALMRISRGAKALEDQPEKYERYVQEHAVELDLYGVYTAARADMSGSFSELRNLYRQRGEIPSDEFEQRVDDLYDRIIQRAQETRIVTREYQEAQNTE